jgi:flagellar biosynthesis protein FliQ
MVAIPAWVWRFGRIVRALIAGVALGVFVAFLAWIGSNLVLPALVVFVLVTLVYGAFMARWMSKYSRAPNT